MNLWGTSSRLRLCKGLVALGVVLVATSPALAQAQRPPKGDAKNQRPGQAQGQPQGIQNSAAKEIAKSQGKLEARQGNRIKILDAENKEVFITISEETAVRYTADADAKWLAPGLSVRFTASFEQGKPTESLKQIEVFTPLEGRLTMEQMREQTPGIYQEGKAPPEGAKGLFAEDKKGAKPPPKTKKEKDAVPAGPGAQSMRVVGKIANVQGNVLTIVAGQPMQVELDSAAKVNVVANDFNTALSFAVKDDAVTVSGLRDPAAPAIIYAERIELKAAKKLEQMQVQPRGRTTGRNRDTDGKDGKDAKDMKDTGKDTKPKPGDPKKPK